VWVFFQVLASSVASGIINYSINSNVAFSTSVRNPSYDAIPGFSVTPQAGTYLCTYNASVFYTTTPKSHFFGFFKNGVLDSNTARSQDTAHSNQIMIDSTTGIISCSGSDVISVKVGCDNTGTITVNQRSMSLIRLGT
jgi:hypothetical protein